MSSIFNLFGGTNVTPRAQKMGSTDMMGKLSSRTPLGGGGPLKQGSASKPKGLSIRSKNDLNVCTPSQKTANIAKAKLNTLDCSMGPTTARQKETVSKLQVVREKQLRSFSPSSKSPFFNHTIKQKGTEDFLFKKPVTPKSNERRRHIYPEPEKIAPYINDDFYLRFEFPLESPTINKFKVSEKTVQPWEDEGFISDPELITPPISPVKLIYSSTPFSDASTQFSDLSAPFSDIDLDAPDLPIMSDSDDDF